MPPLWAAASTCSAISRSGGWVRERGRRCGARRSTAVSHPPDPPDPRRVQECCWPRRHEQSEVAPSSTRSTKIVKARREQVGEWVDTVHEVLFADIEPRVQAYILAAFYRRFVAYRASGVRPVGACAGRLGCPFGDHLAGSYSWRRVHR